MTNSTRIVPDANSANPSLIALDWGTTSLRAYLFDAHGALLDTRSRAAGVMHVPAGGARAFDVVFEEACGDWLDRAPGVPVLAAGMVGSAQGWREAPYVEVPAGADALVAGLVTVTTARGTTVSIVPGVIATGELPDVMRGEETQIFGALANDPMLDADRSGVLIGLPGTHAKWAWVKDGLIERFQTFMTGELFAALRDHTILGRTMRTSAAPDRAAFVRGVAVARGAQRAGLLATIFSTRTLGLTDRLAPDAQGDYLSGLLIGHELNALDAMLAERGVALANQPLLLIGDDGLCARYVDALNVFGCTHARVVAQATERGLWWIASRAGLVRADGEPVCADQ
ncbi:2-dehydro-3-deoxygalactonokinase [Burkholderia diffusa]|uniref:2-dehydro-3-deoxygalactonokinase n=1 Tax=Burkholderia diffusa TaxID=488732 RepID=UPI000754597C|nr:2-dehydro-3-deoxygalactonokinase [Burkholderia diffusa]KVH43741.1 2-dehydro-3-deoxygalactonokinase [Burkholderia diffusa]KWF83085.1 2-dehydro-3-deoxygalactonokinase [Burkholderia diffusa]